MMASVILLATTNLAKQERLAWLLNGLGLRLVRPQDVHLQLQVEEKATSHRGNAIHKAEEWSRAWGGVAIASDGGVRIPSLGRRWSSLRTARFAGPGADDRRRLEALLELMRPYAGIERRASWMEVVAVAQRGEPLGTWRAWSGQCELATSFDPAKLVHGFWVDTLWYVPALGKLFSELRKEEQEQVLRHWSRLKPRLQTFFHRHFIPGEATI